MDIEKNQHKSKLIKLNAFETSVFRKILGANKETEGGLWT